MIQFLRLASLAVLGLACAGAAQADTRFLAAFADVPLAPGLVERVDAAFAFAAPEGRIAETAAAGSAQEGVVRSYYRTALPPLGWSMTGDAASMDFMRGRERLTLTFRRAADGSLTVRYRIVARAASLALD